MKNIWEHEFKSQQKKDTKLKQFIRSQPLFYQKHCWITKESTVIEAMLDDSFLDV